MTALRTRVVTVVVGAALAGPGVAQAAVDQSDRCGSEGVTRLEVTKRESFAGGMSFGRSGPYEKLVGKAYLAVDPADVHNSMIQDLDAVPVDDCGHVRFSTDVYILKPMNMARGNRELFFEVNNRGNKLALNWLNSAPSSNDPTTPADAGNGFLMRRGYTIAWAGWQADVLPGDDRMTIDVPVARRDERPITGTVAVQYDVSRHITGGEVSLSLSGRPDFDPYPADSLDNSTAKLTVRRLVGSEETVVPSDRWAFARCRRDPATGEIVDIVPDPKSICSFDGFDTDRLYQLVYTARNPRPMALGYAATRDVISFLRHERRDPAGAPNPLGSRIANVQCLGISSSGMYVRDYLYLGFNADTSDRRVCDGLSTYIAGGLRLHLNTRFTQPDIYSRQDLWAGLWPMATFPFGYGPTTDPVTGRTDGILKRRATDPLVMHIDTSMEYWQFHASLVTHDGLGRPRKLPDNVRVYAIASAQHGPAGTPERGICQQLSNPLDYRPFGRALLDSLDRWVRRGVEPPPSEYPLSRNGTLVAPDRPDTGFPAIPGVEYTGAMNALSLRDYGPRFGPMGGVITRMPPALVPGSDYTVLVPRVDADGNDVAGLRRPDDLESPLATYTGWNQRAEGNRRGDLCALTGSYVPFPATRAERRASGDPRLSIEERYASHEDYVDSVRDAAQRLRREGYLLGRDVREIVEAAGQRDVP